MVVSSNKLWDSVT